MYFQYLDGGTGSNTLAFRTFNDDGSVASQANQTISWSNKNWVSANISANKQQYDYLSFYNSSNYGNFYFSAP